MVFKDVKLFAETNEEVRKQTYKALFRMNTSKYLAAKVIGGGTKLIEPDSDISLEVARGVSAVIVQHIHTNLESVRCAVPKSECIVSPVVSFRVFEDGLGEVVGWKFKACIPHCLQDTHDLSLVKVRCGNIFNWKSMREVPEGDPKSSMVPCYKIDENCITLYTNHFCDVVCSSEEKLCHKSLVILPFGRLDHDKDERNTFAKVKLFLCSTLYNLPESRLVSYSSYQQILKI